MNKIYGYCRISTKEQSIERQIRNIKSYNEQAIIVQEVYTGTKTEERKELQKLLKVVKNGDTIIFDSVSRMSRNAEEGIKLYMELSEKDINLVFLKEPYINTEVYKKSVSNEISLTGNVIANEYIQATNKVLKMLAVQQIEIAFNQSEKEVQDLQQRTKEGIETARLNGKQIGAVKGSTLNTKRGEEIKKVILAKSKHFNGTSNDTDCMKLANTTRNTFYKYKAELMAELGK